MTKDEFLARCETAWDCGYVTPERLRLMRDWCDFVMRLEGGQMDMVVSFLEQEKERCEHWYSKKLANDYEGYKVIELTSLLAHPCQKCATAREAWHTRPGFCGHLGEKGVEYA